MVSNYKYFFPMAKRKFKCEICGLEFNKHLYELVTPFYQTFYLCDKCAIKHLAKLLTALNL